MAKKGQIKQEIVLAGEKQYNQAIREAQRNIKTLNSALKAETAELGKNATEQQKSETRAKSLKKQIQEQEKIVKTLREALAEVKEKYGDNEDAVQNWERKLNEARATLGNMKNDLDGIGQSFRNVDKDAAMGTVATKSFADALGSLGSAGESAASAIENIFTGIIDTVAGAVSELWDMISATAAKANNWTDIAGYWGTDPQTIQQYARAVQASGNSFEDLQSAVSKLVLGGKGKTITELLGISDANYKNEWDYAMAAMDAIYQMAQEGKDLNPIYEAIFGEKKSTKVMDLINDWESVKGELGTFNGNETGFGMSDEELQTMNDLWVEINKIETKWEAIKENFASGFGQVSMDLLVNVEGTLDGIADYLNAKNDSEKEQALQKIKTNVEEFFTKLADIIRECLGILRNVGEELQGSDDPLTSTIGDILVKLADSLQWIVDNADKVKAAFNTIFGFWMLAKLAAIAGKLGSIIAQIETIKAFKGVSSLFGGGKEAADAATTAASGSSTGVGTAVIGWIKDKLSGIGGAGAGGMALPGLLGTVLAGWKAGWAMINANQNDESLNQVYGDNGGEGGVLDHLTEEQAERVRKYFEQYKNNYGSEEAMDARDDLYKAFEEGGVELAEQAVSLVEKAFENYLNENPDAVVDKLAENHPDIFAGNEADRNAIEQKYGLGSGGLFVPNAAVPAPEAAKPVWTDDLIALAEQMYDEWYNDDKFLELEEQLESALDPETFKKFDNWLYELMQSGTWWDNDLPKNWWQSMGGSANESGITSQDLQGFRGLPGQMAASVGKAVSGIKVVIDGRTAGELLAPYISQEIAKSIYVI